MQIESLPIEGAFHVTSPRHGDSRGSFFEWFKAPSLVKAVGHDFSLAQANCSTSARGTLRGIHYADVPPGQAKYVSCLTGRILDVVVDIRVGSPTFGRWHALELSPDVPQAIYIAEGLGHGFVALEDNSTVIYLCSTVYNPAAEHEVDAFDEGLGIKWGMPRESALLSAKDAGAPSLKQARRDGLLPNYSVCKEHYASLR